MEPAIPIDESRPLAWPHASGKGRALALREPLTSIDFLPCPRYRLHHYLDMACSRFVHH